MLLGAASCAGMCVAQVLSVLVRFFVCPLGQCSQPCGVDVGKSLIGGGAAQLEEAILGAMMK